MENGKTINLMKSKLQKIKSDASFRSFYRVTSNKKNQILVTAQKEKYSNLIAYMVINKILRKNKILAPKVYEHNYSKGTILIEDFGNLSFHKILSKKKKKLATYKNLVNLILKMQKINPKLKIKDIFNKNYVLKKYSNKYLHKESDLFFDWYLPLFLNKKKTLYIKRKAKKILTRVYKKLNYSNSYFVHRDFHVQNLMKVGKRIGLIDSQDAIIGNPSYDLVSLIDDVRIKTSRNLKEKIYNYYTEKKIKDYNFNNSNFLEDFKILSIQRSLKIIGIFSRLFRRDKKDEYLKLLPYAWKLLETRIDSKIFLELKKILDENISKTVRKKSNFV